MTLIGKLIYLLALTIIAIGCSACSFKIESEYFGRTGKRDVSYSPTVEDGDEQYVARVNKRY